MTQSTVQAPSGGGGGNSGGGKGPRVKRPRYALVGSVVVSILAIGLILGMTKPEWQQYFQFGFTTRDIRTTGDYFTLANSSKVKVSGVEVGRIDSVQRQDDGTAIMRLRLQSDVPEKVGSAPSANVRPVSLLGGVIYVDLIPGGDRTQPWQDTIPLERTRLPVELSPVVQAIQPDAVKGIPAGINGLSKALDQGGVAALQSLARNAPAALGPGAGVVNALQGNNPNTDLPALVGGLQRTTSVLARKPDQIESVLRDLRSTTSAFAQSSPPTVQAIRNLPSTLDTAKSGLARLSGTLDNLKATAGPARPTVQELDRLLTRIDPVLVKARPVINDLRYAVRDVRPVVEKLVPASQDLRVIFDGLNAPLDRVNGPVIQTLESGYNPGVGADAGRRHTQVPGIRAPKLRQEVGPALRSFAGAAAYYDQNGHGLPFNVGVGPESVGGVNTTIPLGGLIGILRGLGVPGITPPLTAAAPAAPLAGLAGGTPAPAGLLTPQAAPTGGITR